MSGGGFPYDAPLGGLTWERLHALEDRGLAHGIAEQVYDTGDVSVLDHLERATDADLVVMSRTWEARESAAARVRRDTMTEAASECPWVECDQAGPHVHPDEFRWVNPGDPTAGEVRVLVKADGTVTISEAALAQLLSDAGWERTA